MARLYTRYVCQSCGKISSQSFGRCPGCGAWDSMVEEVLENEPGSSKAAKQPLRGISATSKPRPITQVEGQKEDRIQLKMNEFARVLGEESFLAQLCSLGETRALARARLHCKWLWKWL